MASTSTKPPMTEEKKREIAAFKAKRNAEQAEREKAKAAESAKLAATFVGHSVEELDEICANAQADIDAAKERFRVVRQVRDAKWAEAVATAKIAVMSDAEKLALAQALGLVGAESASKVGSPAAKS